MVEFEADERLDELLELEEPDADDRLAEALLLVAFEEDVELVAGAADELLSELRLVAVEPPDVVVLAEPEELTRLTVVCSEADERLLPADALERLVDVADEPVVALLLFVADDLDTEDPLVVVAEERDVEALLLLAAADLDVVLALFVEAAVLEPDVAVCVREFVPDVVFAERATDAACACWISRALAALRTAEFAPAALAVRFTNDCSGC